MTDYGELSFDRLRLEQLLSEKCNGAISEAGLQELEEIILASSQAREIYWEHLSLHSSLSWTYRGKRECDRRLLLIEDEALVTIGPAADVKSDGIFRQRVWWLPFALAASLLLGLFLGEWQGQPVGKEAVDRAATEANSQNEMLGRMTSISGTCHWTFGVPGERNREEFLLGDTLWLNDGIAELSLRNGTVIQLEAPLIFAMDSILRGRLLRGRITVDVPEGESGFVVDTSAAKVVDLGTTFSVNVADSGDTDVIVFKGEVDVDLSEVSRRNKSQSAVASKRLQTGEALRVTEDGTTSRIVNVRRTNYSSLPAPTSVIREVRDNIVRDETMKYYEIISGGMEEDARVYVDRIYEWNGIDESGIPAYLVGGDYVKTFNDDKVTSHLQIDVALDEPATIYLLVDDRLKQTEWLTDQFVDTGDDIGVDEGPHVENDHRVLGKGPGVSVDQVYSVWRHKTPTDSIVTVGPCGSFGVQTHEEGVKAKLSMYGIVAVASAESAALAEPR